MSISQREVEIGRRPRLTTTTIVLTSVSLVSDLIGVAQWPQAAMEWLTIAAGATAMLLGLPAVWTSRGRGVLFALALSLSLLGAALVGGGVDALARGTAASERPGGPGDTGESGATAVPTLRSSAGSGAPTVAGEEPAVRHEGTVTLNDGYQLDLDSTDPGWGVATTLSLMSGASTDADLEVRIDGVYAANRAQLARADSVSYSDCRAATSFGDTLTVADDNLGRAMLCVRTGDGRVAALRVTGVTKEFGMYLGQIRFSVTVWSTGG